ncbi:MAG TPA: hypothetical protein V6C78_25295 [Crinalium sp.]|jgi:transposase-like protein
MDAHSLSTETQTHLRQQTISLRQQEKAFSEVGLTLGVHRNTVMKWWRLCEQLGESARTQQGEDERLGKATVESGERTKSSAHVPSQLKSATRLDQQGLNS